MAKSLGSCAGVTLTAPVPNSGLAQSSARMGISRSGPERQAGACLPMSALVALVVGVHGDGDVAEHGLGAGGGDDDGAGAVGERVADVVELADALFVTRLRGRRRRSEDGVPVDDVGAAIDEALLLEADEGFLDGDARGGRPW